MRAFYRLAPHNTEQFWLLMGTFYGVYKGISWGLPRKEGKGSKVTVETKEGGIEKHGKEKKEKHGQEKKESGEINWNDLIEKPEVLEKFMKDENRIGEVLKKI